MNKFIKIKINKKEYEVYNNANFSIVTNEECNANCEFCVEALRAKHTCQNDYNNEEWKEKVIEALDFMRSMNTSISITGGEPTLNNNLPWLINEIDKRNFRKKVITTNGSKLNDVLDNLIAAKFNHLNISRVHYDEDINQKIMKFNKGEYIDNEKLEQHIRKANNNNVRVRLSCLINKLGIQDTNDVLDYIMYYKCNGVDNFVFRELMNYDFENARQSGESVNPAKERFYKNNFIDITSVIEELKSMDFEIINEVNGYYYNVIVFNIYGCAVCFEKANLENMKDKKENEIYEFVLHPSGNLTSSWNENDILDIGGNNE